MNNPRFQRDVNALFNRINEYYPDEMVLLVSGNQLTDRIPSEMHNIGVWQRANAEGSAVLTGTLIADSLNQIEAALGSGSEAATQAALMYLANLLMAVMDNAAMHDQALRLLRQVAGELVPTSIDYREATVRLGTDRIRNQPPNPC